MSPHPLWYASVALVGLGVVLTSAGLIVLAASW